MKNFKFNYNTIGDLMINQNRQNIILYLHSIWLRENGYKNWKKCERASKEEKRGSVSVPIAKQGSS